MCCYNNAFMLKDVRTLEGVLSDNLRERVNLSPSEEKGDPIYSGLITLPPFSNDLIRSLKESLSFWWWGGKVISLPRKTKGSPFVFSSVGSFQVAENEEVKFYAPFLRITCKGVKEFGEIREIWGKSRYGLA